MIKKNHVSKFYHPKIYYLFKTFYTRIIFPFIYILHVHSPIFLSLREEGAEKRQGTVLKGKAKNNNEGTPTKINGGGVMSQRSRTFGGSQIHLLSPPNNFPLVNTISMLIKLLTPLPSFQRCC